MSISEHARAYAAHGWALVEFARGTKGPTYHGWNLPRNTTTNPDEAECFSQNIGLCHALSRTCCLDIDDLDMARGYLQLHGLAVSELLADPLSVRITSGRPNRAKLLYRLPDGLNPLPSKRPTGSGLELRCATGNGLTVQDVLPPSIHPVTQEPYRWEYGDDLTGHWSSLPVLPDALLALWRSLLTTPSTSPDKAPQGLHADRLRGMLARLDPDIDYNEWSKVGMALHHETEGAEWGLDLWDEWSAGGSKYKNVEDLVPHWRSFGSNRGRPVTVNSLISMSGGVSPDDFDDLSRIPEQPKRARFVVVPYGAFRNRIGARWIIKNVLADGALGVMFAESGAGKSFAALDWAAAVALGKPWNGQRVAQRRVIYVAAEGAGGLAKRAEAYAQHFGVNTDDIPLGFIADRPNFMKDDHKRLAAAINDWGGAGLVIIDTMAQSMAGGDENSGEDMGKVLANCQALHSATNAMILLIHHSGKDATKGARGWSGLKAAADTEIEIARDGDARSLRVSKQKDGEDGLGWGFRLVEVSLGTDADGDPVTSCVTEWHELAATKRRDKPPQGWQRIVFETVLDSLELCEGSVPIILLLDKAVESMPRDPNGLDRRRDNARRALDKLIMGKWLALDGKNVSVVGGQDAT